MIIQFEDKELDYIFQVLSQRPWGEVNPLLIRIQQQVVRQQQEKMNEAGSDQQVVGLRPAVQ